MVPPDQGGYDERPGGSSAAQPCPESLPPGAAFSKMICKIFRKIKIGSTPTCRNLHRYTSHETRNGEAAPRISAAPVGLGGVAISMKAPAPPSAGRCWVRRVDRQANGPAASALCTTSTPFQESVL